MSRIADPQFCFLLTAFFFHPSSFLLGRFQLGILTERLCVAAAVSAANWPAAKL